MKQGGYCLFDTALGTCAIAWRESDAGGASPAVTFLQLPEATAAMTESRIARSSGARRWSAPPPRIAKLIERVREHLNGHPQDFREIALDLEGVAPFARQVYEAACEIPPGQTRTYGEVAKALGQPGAARAVGQALGRNPIPLIIPCHRVLAAGGRPGGFSAYGGRATKARLLELEGTTSAPPATNLKLNFEGPLQGDTAPQ